MGLYIDELQGVVALPGHMDRSMVNFARSLKLCIENELKKPLPDNALIATLCDAGRVGWELCEIAKKGLDFDAIDRETLQQHLRESRENRDPEAGRMLGGFTSPEGGE